MENASKALIMAGSVLLSLLIIGLLVIMFNNLSDVKRTEATSEEVKKLAEYNKQIETFNRELYGSELISLANLIIDYNIRYPDIKGYTKVKLYVYINYKINEKYMNQTEYKDKTEDLVNDFNSLQEALNEIKKTNSYGTTEYGKTVEKLASMRTSELDDYKENKRF